MSLAVPYRRAPDLIRGLSPAIPHRRAPDPIRGLSPAVLHFRAPDLIRGLAGPVIRGPAIQTPGSGPGHHPLLNGAST